MARPSTFTLFCVSSHAQRASSRWSTSVGVTREGQELHEGFLEPRRETTDGEVVAIDCVDGVELECSTPPRSEKLGIGQAGHRFTLRRSRTVKSSAIR